MAVFNLSFRHLCTFIWAFSAFNSCVCIHFHYPQLFIVVFIYPFLFLVGIVSGVKFNKPSIYKDFD